MTEYTFSIAFDGVDTSLTPGIDWTWWKNASVTVDPFGRKRSKQVGFNSVKPRLSSNALVCVRVNLWSPDCGITLEDIVGKIKYRALPENSNAIAMGLKLPNNGEPQEGNFLIELSPDSHFTMNREDHIQDEIKRYHFKWESLFSRCRLVTDVRVEPLAVVP